jgi:hypothetical protein
MPRIEPGSPMRRFRRLLRQRSARRLALVMRDAFVPVRTSGIR